MRLNCGIPVSILSDEHLFAEQRELKMLPAYFRRYGFKGISKIPSEFTLGRGHILFFAYKSIYTLNRYKQVYNECIRRGYNIKDESFLWDVYGEVKNDYQETGIERILLVHRIVDKVKSSPKKYFHYNHNVLYKDEYISRLYSLINTEI